MKSLIKEEAKKLIESLPEQVTWDDIMYQFYVKKKLATSLKTIDEGKITPHEEVKNKILTA
jgi:hypothetical protein